MKRAEISHRVFTHDKANFHKAHQRLLMALGASVPSATQRMQGGLRDRVLCEKGFL